MLDFVYKKLIAFDSVLFSLVNINIMASKTSHAVNIAAFVCSASLVGLSIAAVYLASDAYNVLTRTFPPGFYGYNLSHYIGDEKSWGVFLWYNRSSEIKTYVAAAFSLFAGLFGAFAFGLSFKVREMAHIASMRADIVTCRVLLHHCYQDPSL